MKGLVIGVTFILIGVALLFNGAALNETGDRLDALENGVAPIGYPESREGDTIPTTYIRVAMPPNPDTSAMFDLIPDQYIVRIDTAGWYKGCVNRRIIFDTLFVAPRGCLDSIPSAQWAKKRREMAWSNPDIINMWVRYNDTSSLSYYICERYHCDSIWLPRTKTIYADKQLLWVKPDDLGRIKRVLEIE